VCVRACACVCVYVCMWRCVCALSVLVVCAVNDSLSDEDATVAVGQLFTWLVISIKGTKAMRPPNTVEKERVHT